MAKVPFTKLKCRVNDNEIPVQMGEETIAVKQYLPIQEKLGLIGRVVMFAHEQDYNYSNPVKIGVYRDLEIVFTYTNISFTDKQKEDLPKLYDTLLSSGLLDIVLAAIPDEEYAVLNDYIEDYMTQDMEYNTTAAAMLKTALAEIPKHMGEATKIMNTFDASKLTEVINFAKQANANRNVE
jgi:hypothetical protein